ncbi:MAG: sigma 54-interacting transcriptional regulator [Pirellulales bacterium]
MPHAQSTAAELASLLDESLAPIYLLDDARRIVFLNRAAARLFGAQAAHLLGQQCVYTSQLEAGSPEALAAGLCPPPVVFSGRPLSAVVSFPGAAGKTVHRRGRFLPLSDGGDESAPVMAVLDTSDCEPTGSDAAGATTWGLALAGSEAQQLHDELRELRRRMARRYQVDSLLGRSPAVVRARAQIELAAQSDVHVLIVGPPGSGKEHAAKAIHYTRRTAGALVPLACDVLEVNLLRSGMRAAWSPTVSAESSTTLLLNDVECMPPEAQSDLLELLSSKTRKVRVISTANRHLAEATAGNSLARSLACALSTITIELPPLSERLEDLPLLAQAVVEEANRDSNKQIGGIAGDALDRLAAYAWPGNVDELVALVRAAHERASGGEISVGDLPQQIRWAAEAGAHPPRKDEAIVLEQFLARVERELIARAMRRAKNNKSKAAKLLGLTRPRLYRRLVQLGMESEQKRPPEQLPEFLDDTDDSDDGQA